MFVKKNVSFLLALCLILSSIILPIHATDTPNDFASKVVYENQVDFGDSSSDASTTLPDSVSVTLQFEHDFTCDHMTFDNHDQVLAHREELKAYYSAKNALIVTDLGLSDHSYVSYSWYGPFIEYEYETYEDFVASDFAILEKANPENLNTDYIRANYSVVQDATLENSTSTYSYTQALADVGIDTEKNYDGTGIKIGILEKCIPNNRSNLITGKYNFFGVTPDSHPFHVSSIIGGSSGIASGATLFIVALAEYSENNAYNILLEKDVDIIHMSVGAVTGAYESRAEQADYLVQNAKVTFVCAAGNYRETDNPNNYVNSPATGVNVISVASSNENKTIRQSSSSALTETWQNVLLKPTLAAPGGNIVGIPNIADTLTGTSFAAPFVTGIVALLMEEFPDLKLHPERVMALLANSCTKVAGQSSTLDANAGFGLVNYARARAYYNNGANFTVTIANAAETDAVYTMNVTVPAYTSIHITAAILYNYAFGSTATVPNFTPIKIVVKNNTSNLTTDGTVKSNYSYVEMCNDTDAACEFSILIYTNGSKALTTDEYGAFTYRLVPHDFTYHYVSVTASVHKAYCACGDYIAEHHDFTVEGNYLCCVDCGYLLPMMR